MCSLFAPCGSMGTKLRSSEASGQESLPTQIHLVLEGGVIAPGNQLHREVQEGAPSSPSVL